MSKTIKRAIVAGLDKACFVVDYIPGPVFLFERDAKTQWSRHAGYGCYVFGIATKAFELADKWDV